MELDGRLVSLKTVVGESTALLIFYRGGWCPFCNKQLAAISQDFSKFKEFHVKIVAVSAEEVEKGKELLQRHALPYTLLSDTRFEGIDRYGVRETNVSEQLKTRGVTSYSKPAAFIVDGQGIIRYVHVGKNAQDRPNNEELLRVLASATTSEQTFPEKTA